jgi:hypothetical protein
MGPSLSIYSAQASVRPTPYALAEVIPARCRRMLRYAVDPSGREPGRIL